MGYYTPDGNSEYQKPKKRGTANGLKWVAVIAISAIVGSGTTFALIPALKATGALPTSLVPSAVQQTTDSSSVTPVTSSQINVTVNNGITKVFKQVEPAVMAVVNYGQVSNTFSQSSQLQPVGVGSGVLFYKKGQFGYVVTNNHVVQGSAKVVAVLSSGKHVNATVVGTDPYTDLAVIKLPISDVQNIAPAAFANSDTIQTGETAIAIGTPMGLDFADSVTAGIVSAKSRLMPVEDPQSQQTLDYQAVIQTDASINPGNSGGPLLNIAGQVMGINSSKIVATGFQGMGFAIPSNEVLNIANQIIQTGHATHPSIGIDGYSLSSLPQPYWPNVPVDYGVWVQKVTSSEAQKAGLKANDVIVGLDGKTVQNMADLRTYLFQHKPGDVVTLDIYRGSTKMSLKLTLGSMASPNTTVQSQSSGQSGQGSSSDPLNPFGSGQFGG
ncbi:S1C family serine protease [Alicyclobacillus mengziensis]|uniref:Trypsin-like peptidase domain-containing protein n=1 Tax=Alicyclobacillus mengziensis TaxID=2931921 RepID=A0A9X7VZ98_9BACL|nr:trypsin-like peptidase domain-containing protein [Alicyclobacillus mengziensis]QSO47781.1 trypsin-like peptidase domain-containing protein [Alicyclobacillus mengziensis]